MEDEGARHLAHVTDGNARAVSRDQCRRCAHEHGGGENGACAGRAQTERAVRVTPWIGDVGNSAEAKPLEEALPLLGRPHVDERQPRATRLQRFPFARQPRQRLAAERSAEVAKEDEEHR